MFFGGCERNVRGKFELAGVGGFGGYPDRYLDADASVGSVCPQLLPAARR